MEGCMVKAVRNHGGKEAKHGVAEMLWDGMLKCY